MTVTDEMLMAYVDGELDTETRAQVEREIRENPELVRKVERQRELRGQLRGVFDKVLKEPVPEHLIDVARTAPAGTHQTNVTDLESIRRARAERQNQGHDKSNRRRWSWPEWGAMAASLIIGLLLGKNILFPSNGSPIATQGGRLVAQGSLARALSHQIAGEHAASGAVQVALSFRDRSGDYCRTFVLQDGSKLTGLACRGRKAWQIEVLTQDGSQAAGGEHYRMAGTALPQSVLQAVEEKIAGEPLDAAGEAKARSNGWK